MHYDSSRDALLDAAALLRARQQQDDGAQAAVLDAQTPSSWPLLAALLAETVLTIIRTGRSNAGADDPEAEVEEFVSRFHRGLLAGRQW